MEVITPEVYIAIVEQAELEDEASMEDYKDFKDIGLTD